MNQEQAKNRLRKFIGDQILTFSLKQFPGEKWIAQCNEIDSIITCGIGYDQTVMENLIQDAIITAAGIPAEFSDKLLKRVWNNDVDIHVNTELNSGSLLTLLQSTYQVNHHYAGVGQI